MKIKLWVATDSDNKPIAYAKYLGVLVDHLDSDYDRVQAIYRVETESGMKLTPPPNELPF